MLLKPTCQQNQAYKVLYLSRPAGGTLSTWAARTVCPIAASLACSGWRLVVMVVEISVLGQSPESSEVFVWHLKHNAIINNNVKFNQRYLHDLFGPTKHNFILNPQSQLKSIVWFPFWIRTLRTIIEDFYHPESIVKNPLTCLIRHKCELMTIL